MPNDLPELPFGVASQWLPRAYKNTQQKGCVFAQPGLRQ
jgi:hypothetical protein